MAITVDRNIIRYGTPDGAQSIAQPAGSSVTVYRGHIALTDSNGLVKAATTPTSNDTCWGLINGYLNSQQAITQANAGIVSGTTSGVDYIGIDTGSFYLANGTGSDAIAQANVGATCYVLDEITVGATSGSSTRPVAGRIEAIGTGQYAGLIAVKMGNNQSSGSP